MDDGVVIRRATDADVPFLVEAICSAEKAGTDCLSYCRIFDLDEAEFRQRLASMLNEDIEGQELCISGFLIATIEGQAAGACCAWIESDETPSAILKANVLMHGIDAERMRAALSHFPKLAELSIPRAPGALQIESVYVRPSARGRGIVAALIDRHIDQRTNEVSAGKAQVILTAANHAARRAYERAGFHASAERWSNDESVLLLVPSRGKLLMERLLIGGG